MRNGKGEEKMQVQSLDPSKFLQGPAADQWRHKLPPSGLGGI